MQQFYKLFLTLRYMKFIVAMCSTVRMKNGLEFRIFARKASEESATYRVYGIIVRGNFISKSHTCSNRVCSTIIVALGGRSCHVFALRAAATLEIALNGGCGGGTLRAWVQTTIRHSDNNYRRMRPSI